MNSIEAFLIDIDFLKTEINNNYNFEFILNKTSNNLIFGVLFDKYNYQLKLNSIVNYGIKCEVTSVKGNLNDKIVMTNVYIICNNLNIQLAIFHRRGEYFWIGSDVHGIKEIKKKNFFGDVDRAMNLFKIKSLDTNVRIPDDVSAFLYDYKHSKFIECNKKLAEFNRIAAGYRPITKKTENDFLFGLKYIKNVLEGFNKNYWLAAGTLLGWYRECSIISHTTDVDLAIWSDDFETKIKEHFLKSDKMRLAITIGLIKEAYELRLFSKTSKTFDLFLMYKHNESFQWNGYHTQRHIYR